MKIKIIIALLLSSTWFRTYAMPIACGNAERISFSKIPADVDVTADLTEDGTIIIAYSGIFPNGCYSSKTPDYYLDKRGDVYLRNLVTFAPNRQCTFAIVPYFQKIVISELSNGRHTLFIKNSKGDYVRSADFMIRQPIGYLNP